MEIYIRAARGIPAELYGAAVDHLIETWTWPQPPQPGDILREVNRINGERRRQEREDRQRRDHAEMVANAMTPGQARELLTSLAEQPEPDDKALAAARELQMRLLAVAATRGDDGAKRLEEGNR